MENVRAGHRPAEGVETLMVPSEQHLVRRAADIGNVDMHLSRAPDAIEAGGDAIEIDRILAGMSEGGRQTAGAYRKTWR